MDEDEAEVPTYKIQTAWDFDKKCWRVEFWYERNESTGDFTKGFTMPVEFPSQQRAAAFGLHLYRGTMVGGFNAWWVNNNKKDHS